VDFIVQFHSLAVLNSTVCSPIQFVHTFSGTMNLSLATKGNSNICQNHIDPGFSSNKEPSKSLSKVNDGVIFGGDCWLMSERIRGSNRPLSSWPTLRTILAYDFHPSSLLFSSCNLS